MRTKNTTINSLWDHYGIGISAACAIHCLLFPILISVLPLFSYASLIHEWAHPVFIILLAPVVFFAMKENHYNFTIAVILVTGFISILLGWLLGHFWVGFIFETSVTLFGSGLLISGHWFNYRLHRSSKKQCKHDLNEL